MQIVKVLLVEKIFCLFFFVPDNPTDKLREVLNR